MSRYTKADARGPQGDPARALVEKNRDVLEAFADALRAAGKTGDEMLLVCLTVESIWRPLVDALMPGFDWQPLRVAAERTGNPVMAAGARPVDRVASLLTELHGIDIRPFLHDPPPAPGALWVAVGFPGGLGLAQLRARGER